jgi:hypothetical protein
LGQKSELYHKNLSKVINNSDIYKVFIKGEKTLFTYKNLNKNKRGNILQNKNDIDFILRDIINTTIREVITDKPVRNVKYLKTFKKEYCSIREVNKLNNIKTFYHFFTQNI